MSEGRLFLQDISTALPSLRRAVGDSGTLDETQKRLLESLGFRHYHVGSREEDAVELALRSAAPVIARRGLTSKDVGLVICAVGGSPRAPAAWPLSHLLTHQLGLSASPSLQIWASCVSTHVALKMAQGQFLATPALRHALIISSYAYLAPDFPLPLEWADTKRRSGIVFGAGATTLLLSREGGEFELLDSSLGFHDSSGELWNTPIGRNVERHPEVPEVYYPGPLTTDRREARGTRNTIQGLVGANLDEVAACLLREGAPRQSLTANYVWPFLCPWPPNSQGNHPLQDGLMERLPGTEVTIDGGSWAGSAHVGPCDLGLFLDTVRVLPSGATVLHLGMGQGYAVARALFRKI
jgi:hypothetical protein